MTRQNEKKVGDIMVSADCKAIFPDNTLQDAVELIRRGFNEGKGAEFLENGFLLVCDKSGTHLGLVTFCSILQALEPFFARAGVFLSWRGLFSDRCREEARTRVKEIMKPLQEIAVKPADTLSKAVHNMLVYRLGSLPVVENNRVVGKVSFQELFREIYHAMGKNGCQIAERDYKKFGVLPAQHPFRQSGW